jgi:hypothetical protein
LPPPVKRLADLRLPVISGNSKTRRSSYAIYERKLSHM